MSEALRDYVRLRTICEGALELDEDRREGWVRSVCSGDRQLLRAALDLLARMQAEEGRGVPGEGARRN